MHYTGPDTSCANHKGRALMTATSSAHDDSHESPPMRFDGVISPELRQRLITKRQAIRMSLRDLGARLGVSWSTLRKWERGEISHCHRRHQEPLWRFLHGDLDRSPRPDQDPSPALPAERDGNTMLYMQAHGGEALISLPATNPDACLDLLHSAIEVLHSRLHSGADGKAAASQRVIQPDSEAPALPEEHGQ